MTGSASTRRVRIRPTWRSQSLGCGPVGTDSAAMLWTKAKLGFSVPGDEATSSSFWYDKIWTAPHTGRTVSATSSDCQVVEDEKCYYYY
mmetsp:Transcript_97189/g.145642  ORF Transcript_97189/g.145642 Transcript_97189/m.145642 type:complete len:89 (-) Transcript_97189:359-625(-)